MLYLNCPAAAVGLCAVVPFGIKIASVFDPASMATVGVACPIPILEFVLSTAKEFVLTVRLPTTLVVVPDAPMLVSAANESIAAYT